MSITVGIDTGGTFTDLVAVDHESGRWHVAKVPSNPDNPVAAIDASLGAAGFDPADVGFVVVGTTIGINAVLTRRGARVVYLTTEGFQDVPHIQRMSEKTPTTSTGGSRPRSCTHPIASASPSAWTRKGACSTRSTSRRWRRRSRRSSTRARTCPRSRSASSSRISIPSTSWPRASCSRQRFPELAVSLSHEVAPIWREYERGTTVTVDAYLKPLFERYVDGVSSALEGKGAPEGTGRCSSRTAGTRSPARRAPGRRTSCSRASRAGPSAAPTPHARRERPRRSRSTWAARAATSA